MNGSANVGNTGAYCKSPYGPAYASDRIMGWGKGRSLGYATEYKLR